MLYLVTRWFGVFLVEDGEVVEKKLFPQDAEELADRIIAMQSGEVLDEEREIVVGIGVVEEKEMTEVLVTEHRQTSLGKYEFLPFPLVPEDHGLGSELLHSAMLVVARKGLAAPGRDRLLIEAMGALDELNKTVNLLSERLAEWYGHHSHDLVRSLSSKKLVEVVAAFGTADEIRGNTDLDAIVTGEMEPEDMAPIRSLARLLQDVMKEKERMERYIRVIMTNIAPNTSAVAGPVLGARLIAAARGLERLAMLPASTVQVLGAETALFLHLREGKKPPKHGYIFQHTLVHNAPQWQRGKISRSLAAKISIAARVDNASGRDISKDILEQLDKRMDEIRKRYPNPPIKKREGQYRRGGGGGGRDGGQGGKGSSRGRSGGGKRSGGRR
ncbi:MAG: ribosomal biogenesis protein [Thermoplasmata archaeon]|nr:ribosomal biogenesis protein [Thermoplasmata archaeon]